MPLFRNMHKKISNRPLPRPVGKTGRPLRIVKRPLMAVRLAPAERRPSQQQMVLDRISAGYNITPAEQKQIAVWRRSDPYFDGAYNEALRQHDRERSKAHPRIR